MSVQSADCEAIQTDEEDIQTVQRMPKMLFEGVPVEGTVMKISGKTPIEDDPVVVSIDDVVLLITECRVTDVRHYVNGDGQLIREQVLKPQRAVRGQWDPSNPNDDGVVRAGSPRP